MNAGDYSARIAHDIKFAQLIASNRGEVICGCVEQGCPRKGRAALREHPETAAHEIAKHIGAIERGNFCSVVNVSANHRLVALAVVVLEDGHGKPRHRAARRGTEAMQTFPDAPAEICAS